MIKVDYSSIKRMKNHFLQYNEVECILGNNGYVWVGYNPQKKQETDMIDTIVRGDTKIVRETVQVPLEVRQ